MKFSINRSWLILVVALSIGGVAAFGVNRYINHQMAEIEARSKGAMVRVLVPREDLPKGTVLTDKLVAVREVPVEWAHSNAISPDQFGRVDNQRLAYPVVHGQMLLWSLMEGERTPSFSSRLVAGRRAITVPVDDENSISGMLEPGDRIDLVVSVKKEARLFMFPLLQNVTVMATGTRTAVTAEVDGKESRRTFNTITLEASPEEAQRVLAAREVGKVAALLRSPGDSAPMSSQRVDSMSLLGLGAADALPLRSSEIPVMYGGRAGPGGNRSALALSPGASASSPLNAFTSKP